MEQVIAMRPPLDTNRVSIVRCFLLTSYTCRMNTGKPTALIWSTDFALHETGSHPERPERIDALERALTAAGMFNDRAVYAPQSATVEALEMVHPRPLIERIRRLAEHGGGAIDPDTVVSPDSWEVALLAAGGAIQAVDLVQSGAEQRVFVLGRPPGHHAEPNRAMGFCLFNNVAIAARHAIAQYGLERVAIVDWDVHHGNGTQAAFWDDPSVLFISLHQYPFYPGTGAAGEQGGGRGEGFTINLPLPAGCTDAIYVEAFTELVVPALEAFQPELMLISAGFDAHRSDPLGQMQVSTECFGELAALVQEAADRCCEGRLVLILEGGYNLDALGASVVQVIETLDGRSTAYNR